MSGITVHSLDTKSTQTCIDLLIEKKHYMLHYQHCTKYSQSSQKNEHYMHTTTVHSDRHYLEQQIKKIHFTHLGFHTVGGKPGTTNINWLNIISAFST